ncbi:hypothetical protein CU669_01110 [Paramagnetospirillum kuznetsovii]|uniref:SnoaL-like domain-containing protein n=1 Tax=Paramagnetospirillum kuznetsovii TaxID=2053833 RepID=A0A364P310_9PROT|nr:hypothetical protein CU669_01110 [Paramagnetospirillum kuznetsovii]
MAILALLVAVPADAGPLDERKAVEHLDAVAAGNLDVLMRDYSADAYMDWVGGGLDGRYRGKEQIQAVWTKFIANNDGQPRPAKFSKPHAYANPKGASIEASAEYGGKAPVKVWHVMVYRDGELATEIWQIDPTIKAGP